MVYNKVADYVSLKWSENQERSIIGAYWSNCRD